MSHEAAWLRTPGDFGLALQQARLNQGISQQQLADQLGLPQSTISLMESGKSTLYLRRLLTIARAVGVEFSATWQTEQNGSSG